MTLKPGDQVWVGPLTLDEYGEAEWYDGDDERLAHDQSAIPDIPHINTICRYLADHPETVDALVKAFAVVESYDTTPYIEAGSNVLVSKAEWDAIDHGISDGMKARISGFLKAMRGEGGE